MWILILTFVFYFLVEYGTSTVIPTTNTALRVRNGPGMTDADTFHMLGRALHKANLQSRDTVYKMDQQTIGKSWHDSTLYGSSSENSAKTKIVCSNCYVTGSINAQLNLGDDFDPGKAIDTLQDEAKDVADQVVDQLKSEAEDVWGTIKDIASGDDDVDNFSLNFDSIDLNLDNITTFADAHLHVEFDDLELYLELDTQLPAATYTINLYTSDSPAEFLVPDITTGVIFTLDLILIADSDTEVESGIHIKIEDGLGFDLQMFDKNLSSINVPDGHFEFLPLTAKTTKGGLRAILRLQASLGVQLALPSLVREVADLAKVGIGANAAIFAYLADMKMSINDTEAIKNSDDCDGLPADLEYTLAVGAAAGATVAHDSQAWGPTAQMTVPIWYTTLTSTCAETGSASTTLATTQVTAIAKRDDSDDGDATDSYTIVTCKSTGIVDCPASLQATSTGDAVSDNSNNVVSSVTSRMPFGQSSGKITATSGVPTPYDPSSSNSFHGMNKNLTIGLSVGLGVGLIVILALLISWFIRRRKKNMCLRSESKIALRECTPPPYESRTMG